DQTNPIWEITASDHFHLPEQESGQILIDKEKCWKELNLCLHFNRQSKYYKLIYGDKDTFKFAWLALRSPFYMVPTLPGMCGISFHNSFFGNTIVQYDHEQA